MEFLSILGTACSVSFQKTIDYKFTCSKNIFSLNIFSLNTVSLGRKIMRAVTGS